MNDSHLVPRNPEQSVISATRHASSDRVRRWRALLAILLGLVALFGMNVQAARAQQADGVIGWVWNNVGYPSPDEACKAQWLQYMNNGHSRFIGAAATDSPIIKGCEWTRYQWLCPEETGAGFACGTIIPTGVSFKCAYGYVVMGPGLCAPLANRVAEKPCDCDHLLNGGNLAGPVRGDPVIVKTGAVVESAVDYSSDDGRFVLARRYRSKATLYWSFAQDNITNLGGRWTYDFAPELQIGNLTGTPSAPSGGAAFVTPGGANFDFTLRNTGQWQQTSQSGAADIDTRLKVEFLGTLPAQLNTLRSASTQWRVTDSNDTVWTMQTFRRPNTGIYALGRPTSRVWRDGYRWDYVYAADGSLTSITDSYGRTATFEWVKFQVTNYPLAGANAQPIPIGISKITLPDQTQIRFTYDMSNLWVGQARNLLKVERLDTNLAVVDSTTYLYEDTRYRSFVTGVINHRGERVASWTFASLYGMAASAEGPGGADLHTFSYVWTTNTLTTTVTGPLGKVDTYVFTKATGYDYRLTSVNGLASANTLATTTTLVNNAGSATLTSMTDALLRQTTYLYDSVRRPTSVTEAAGTTAARTTTVSYDPSLNLPVTVTRPGLTEARTYTAGKLTALTLTDTTTLTLPYATNGRTRTWGYGWSPSGQLLSVDGPLPGAADTVTMSYDAAGQLLTQTNPLGHITTVIARNPMGKPLTVRDANGVDTTLTYDVLGRPLTVTRDPGTNQSQYAMTYDATGNLTRVTLPTGGWLNYTYDGANRVTRIDNDSGEYLTFTLNAAGLPTAETTYAPGALIQRQNTSTYDELGRLIRATGAGGQVWQFAYDKLGNLTSSVDARSKPSSSTVDRFDRPVTATNPENQTQAFAYTQFDAELTQFTDARLLATTMVVDGFGETLQETSPDRGVTKYWYDAARRITQTLDARGVTTAFTYDAANRPLTESSSGSGFTTQTITYTYDSTTGGNRGIGRLTSVSDPSGSESLVYDAQGRVTARTKTIAGQSYTFGYVFDASGQLTQITYPSGHIVKYVRAPDGRIMTVRALNFAGGTNQPLASAITWKPFGPLASFTQGNGLSLTRSYDGNYWLSGVSLSGGSGSLLGLTFTRDANGRVTAMTDSAAPLRNASYTYSDAGRLATAVGTWGSDSYAWDANSNRTRADRVLSGTTTSDVATLATGTNRLSELRDGAGVLSRSFAYTPAGNTSTIIRTGAPTLGYSYDARGRLIAVTSTPAGGSASTIASYAYDWREQRVAASSAGAGAVHYLYAEDGQLLAEMDAQTGTMLREYVWLDTMPLATITGPTATPSYSWITTGNLNEPLLLTNASGAVTASTTRDPWGNPILLAGGTPLDLGYPGQWKDPATGLFQNWHRDYDPTLGRYVETDPIGLGGGSNLFGYVGGDPVNAVDPDGRNPVAAAFLACRLAPNACAALGASIVAGGAWLLRPRDPPVPPPSIPGYPRCDPDDEDPCEIQYDSDIGRCTKARIMYGKAGFAQCASSALRRRGQCKNRQPLEPLTGVDRPLYRD